MNTSDIKMTVYLSVYNLFQDTWKQTPCSVERNAWTTNCDVNLPVLQREQKKKVVTSTIKSEIPNYKLTERADSNLETLCINEHAQRARSPKGNTLGIVIQLHYTLRHHWVQQCGSSYAII